MSWSEVSAGPAFGFTIVGLIVVFGPLVAERLRLPGLLGLLIGGAVIGPNMLEVLDSFDSLESVGQIGVLYLIFLAGLQLDIEAFMRYRRISAGFALLTAFIPLVLGTAAAMLLDLDFKPALLVGSFWASFTLITYPTVCRYGLTRNRAVAAIVGASAITDTISLIILALIIGSETGDSSGAELVARIALGLAVLAVYCLVVAPRVVRWFFAGVGQERTLRFALVLISLTSAAVVAELVGIEALIGAFFVGVGLNRIVPNASPLMSMTDFFGNAIFIPAFLVSVGLLFDPEVMFLWSTLRLGIGFGAALVIGKAIAAWLSGRIYGLGKAEVGLMFSMSIAQAAATLAATVIGLGAGLYGEEVVNAVMVVVAVSLVMTSVGTGRFAPQIAPPQLQRRRVGEAVLVPVVGDDELVRNVFMLAGQLTEPAGGVVAPLVVTTSMQPDAIDRARAQQVRADDILRHLGQDVDTQLRVDRSVAAGLNREAVQADSSMLLLGWPGPDNLRSWLLGADYDEILAATAVPIVIAALHGEAHGRVLLLARDHDLAPGNLPSLQLGVDIASTLRRSHDTLIVGPLSPTALTGADLRLPDRVEHRKPRNGDNITAWALANTEPGDLIVVPFRDLKQRSFMVEVFDAGRSILAVTDNPESWPGLTGRSLTMPVGGSIGPT